ncbi:MAG: hypothetical protein PHR36_04400 [Patescibacteria group bacterium]|nr:hypothetical protein [Patescibacteria group bacterium]
MDTAVKKPMATYETVETKGNVLVNAPIGKFVRWMKEFIPDGQPPVPAHYQHGVLIQGTGVIVNDHYFNIGGGDLGTRICATVEVVKKTMPDGRVFILRNIRRCEPDPAVPFFVMKFKKGAERGTPIPGTDLRLQFNRTTPPTE